MTSLFGILVFSTFLHADNIDPQKPYLDLEITNNSGIPAVKFYSAKNFAGSPELELNRKGLFAGQTKLCSFNSKDALSDEDLNTGYFLLMKAEEEPCPQDNPVRSYAGDGGIGTSVISLQFEDIEGMTAVGIYKGKKVYFDLKSLGGRYQLFTPKHKDEKPSKSKRPKRVGN